MFQVQLHHPGRLAALSLAACLALGLAGCSPDDRDAGAAAPGSGSGPSIPPVGSPIGGLSGANVLNPLIISVAVGSGRPTVTFRLTDEDGHPRTGLTPSSSLRFTIARLIPAIGGRSSEWRSYIAGAEDPVAGFPGTMQAMQANYEATTAGVFTDRGDGSYTYQFASDITTVAGLPYDDLLTHRVAMQFPGSLPVDSNAAFTWQPASGAVSGIFSREIVDDDTCNACHDRLMFHGGTRRDVQYCVTCHNPYSADAQSGNTVDFTAMIHKIHHGAGLPSVKAGGSYFIVGFGNSVHDYSGVAWSQDIRNCRTCHDESDAKTPQAQNWRLVQNAAACGSCHDDVDFTTGTGHAAGAATDDSCSLCHGPNATLYDGALRVTRAHALPLREAAARFRFNVLSVTNTAPGQFPSVRFSVTDPTDNDAAWNIHNAAPFTQCTGGASRLAIVVGWNSAEFTNAGTGTFPAQPIQINPLAACGGASTSNGDGSFTVTSPVAVPVNQSASLMAVLEGHPALDADGNGTIDRIAVPNAFAYAAITGSATPRRAVVEIRRCNECHSQLSLHGNNRTDSIEACVTCHNPGATDVNRRAGQCLTDLGPDDVSVDFKTMIHRIHASGETGVPYEVCGFGDSTQRFNVTYPGALNNCEGCHRPDTYYPVDPARVYGPTVDANNPALYTDDVAVSPNAAVCSGCHTGAATVEHMTLHGADYLARKDVLGRMISPRIENCAACHGPRGDVDVKAVHNIAFFRFN